MILATDLDGTFLGGSEEAKHKLYKFLEARDDIRLIFVTGRGKETVIPLLSDPTIPQPDYLICDVGATVVDGDTLEPVDPLQAEISQKWPGTRAVIEALEDFDFLERQDVPQERRSSYYTERSDIDGELREAVDKLECEILFSADRYLDVLPAGVTKGNTLQQLAELKGYDVDDIFVAGDTLNDLSLFTHGFRGVVVGNAEDQLVDEVGHESHVYLAEEDGAGGILEALDAKESMVDAEHPTEAELDFEIGDAQLVQVYHRLPFEEVEEDGETVRKPHSSPNGIIPTLLGFFEKGFRGSWVAWSYQESRDPDDFERHVQLDDEAYSELSCARIPLTEEDVTRFYKKFSKEAFWPIIFSFPGKAQFNEDDWEHYVEINRIFARRTAEEAENGALVWIHDYNLWLVPGFLRQMRPDLDIAFFHHTAFPPPDIFNIIPWRREIVSSLLQCDYVGFHVPRYVQNFVEIARSHTPVEVTERQSCAPRFLTYGCAMGVDEMVTELDVGERSVRLGANPVGINVDSVRDILGREHIRDMIAGMRLDWDGLQVILSVERLDYVKGPLEKLRAFETMLENHPELHEEVVLMTINPPPSRGMEAYDKIRSEVDEAVGRINGRFSTIDWTPVQYYFQSFPFEEVIAHYAVADVGWITPLRDGLNLVAKEFVATKGLSDTDGVLVLSEFAGAAVELHGSLLTNPYHHKSMAETLYRALTLDEEERRIRTARLFDIVSANDVETWGEEFVREATT